MGMSAGRVWLSAALTVALAACAADSKTEDLNPNIFPTKYKQEVLDTLSRTLDYPANVRDAFITDPTLAPVGKDQRYISLRALQFPESSPGICRQQGPHRLLLRRPPQSIGRRDAGAMRQRAL